MPLFCSLNLQIQHDCGVFSDYEYNNDFLGLIQFSQDLSECSQYSSYILRGLSRRMFVVFSHWPLYIIIVFCWESVKSHHINEAFSYQSYSCFVQMMLEQIVDYFLDFLCRKSFLPGLLIFQQMVTFSFLFRLCLFVANFAAEIGKMLFLDP